MRRDPSAILAAHRMDPRRREVYVEGPRDVAFLRWLVADAISPNALLLPAEFVDIPQGQGGARGRLLTLAQAVLGQPATIRVFVDADYDRLLGVVFAANTEVTDGRDLEGYLLNENCLEKILRLGLHRLDLDPRALLTSLLTNGRRLGLLRLTSQLRNWRLPFHDTSLYRYVSANGVAIRVDYDALIQTLLQRSGRGLADRPLLYQHLAAVEAQFAGAADSDLTHGKDALQMIARLCRHCGFSRETAEPMFWTSFERALAPGFPALSRIQQFLSAA